MNCALRSLRLQGPCCHHVPRIPSAAVRRTAMKVLALALALVGSTSTAGYAQDAIPDLKGTWSGKGKSIVFGTHHHHPGTQTTADPPRVRDIEATHVVLGQEGRVA